MLSHHAQLQSCVVSPKGVLGYGYCFSGLLPANGPGRLVSSDLSVHCPLQTDSALGMGSSAVLTGHADPFCKDGTRLLFQVLMERFIVYQLERRLQPDNDMHARLRSLLLSCRLLPSLPPSLPLWESREVLIRITVQAITCNKASPESMAKFGSFMGKPGVPRVRVRLHSTPYILSKGQPAHNLRTLPISHL